MGFINRNVHYVGPIAQLVARLSPVAEELGSSPTQGWRMFIRPSYSATWQVAAVVFSLRFGSGTGRPTALCETIKIPPDGRRQNYPLTWAECCGAGWLGLGSRNKLSLSIRPQSQIPSLQPVRTKFIKKDQRFRKQVSFIYGHLSPEINYKA